MNYLFDECTSDKLVNLLREIGCKDVWFITKQFKRGTKDHILLPQLNARDCILVTNDPAMLTEHAAILNEHRVEAIFLPPRWSEIGKRRQAIFLLTHWPKIDEQKKKSRPIGLIRLSLSGKLNAVSTNYQITENTKRAGR